MDRIPERIDSKFRYVLLASQRAEQLVQGARPKVEATSPKPTRVGMQEITSNVIDWDYGPAEDPEAEVSPGEGEDSPPQE